MEKKEMPYFRDSSRPEDYWSDGQWQIYRTMKGMDILPSGDDLAIPPHIEKGSVKVADGAGIVAGDTTGTKPVVKAPKPVSLAALPMAQNKLSLTQPENPAKPPVYGARAYEPYTQADSGKDSFAQGLRYGGRDPADQWKAVADLSAIPQVKAMGYIGRSFHEGNTKLAGKAVDPFIHSWNIMQSNFTPAEHLGAGENAAVQEKNKGAVPGLAETSDGSKETTKYLMSKESTFIKNGQHTPLGELVNKSNRLAHHASEALVDTFGGKLWNAASVSSDAVSGALKEYRDKMLAYREMTDDEICDPAANPFWGSLCQKQIRSGIRKREVAMKTRKNLATLHALKKVGINIGVDQLKKYFAKATGQSGESAAVQFWQNLAMELVQKKRLTYGTAMGTT